jgi:hypothetical protein
MKTRVALFATFLAGLIGLQWLPSHFNLLTPTAAHAQSCVGDCGGDGEVTVNELLTMVNIALGNADVSTCTAGDTNQDGEITINEILAAVNNALNGCPAGGTPTPTPTPTPSAGGSIDQAAAVAGRTTLAIDSVTVISSMVAAVANGFQFGGAAAIQSSARDLALSNPPIGQAAGDCPLGGTATKTGNAFTGETATFTGCKAATFDGSVTFDGSLTIGVLSGIRIDVTSTFEDQNGTTIEVATANVTGPAVVPALGGSCYLTAIPLTLTGTLNTTMPNGPTVGLTLNNTSVSVAVTTFNSSCVPTVYDITLNGAAALLEPDGGSQSVTFSQLVIHIDSSASDTTVTVNGGMQSTCFSGTVMLATITPLTVPSGDNCPTAGEITATSDQGETQITFLSDGSVMIGTGADSLTAPNCLDPRLLMCVA